MNENNKGRTDQGKIYQQIPLIMAEVGAISKTRKNSQGSGYMFRGIDDVYLALQPLLHKHKVFCVPSVLESKREERQSKSGGTLIYTVLTVDYTFYAEDGSSFRSIVSGEAMDSGDKSCNKAMSAAYKIAFLQIFCIPTEEEKDTEYRSPEPIPGLIHESNQKAPHPSTNSGEGTKYSYGNQTDSCPACSKAMMISKYPSKETGNFDWYCTGCKKSVPRQTSMTSSRMVEDDLPF